MNLTMVTFDLADATADGRKAFNTSLRNQGWTRYATLGEKRLRLPETTWLTTSATEHAVRQVLDTATIIGTAAQPHALSVKRVMASWYSRIYFDSPQADEQNTSGKLKDVANLVIG